VTGDRLVEPVWKASGFVRPKARARINPLGRRGRERQTAWARVRAELAVRSGGRCEACATHHLPECSGRYEHAHHVTPRSAGGRDELANALAVGHAHHNGWIHNHPREARALGFLRYGVDTWNGEQQ
jgi:hypothetical protein